MLWLRPVYLLVQTVSAWPASLACHRSTQGHFSQEIEMHTRFIVRGAGNRQPMRASTVAKVLLPVVAATCSIVFGDAGSAIIRPSCTGRSTRASAPRFRARRPSGGTRPPHAANGGSRP